MSRDTISSIKITSPPIPSREVQMIGDLGLHTPVSGNCQAPRSTPTSSRKCLFGPDTSSTLLGMGCEKIANQTRLDFNPSNFDESTDSEGGLESTLVEHALTSLPHMVERVVDKHNTHTDEVARQQTKLAQVKKEVAKEKEKLAGVEADLASVQRKLYLVEEDCDTSDKECKKFQQEIDEFLSKNDLEQQEIEELKKSFSKAVANFMTYYDKIDEHKKVVAEMEKRHPIQQELQHQEEKVESLKKRKNHLEENPLETERMVNGKVEKEMQAVIEKRLSELQNLGKEVTQKKGELAGISKEQAQLQQDINVLNKRNAAQLTRLKKQLPEVQTRNQKKNEQVTYLEKTVSQMKMGQEQ